MEDTKLFKVNKPWNGDMFQPPVKRVVHKDKGLIEIKSKEVKQPISLKEEPRKEVRNYEIEKVELSKNIQAFDKKPKVYTENPYGYNQVSLKKEKAPVPPVQTAAQMIINPTYNSIGKFLGVDTIHDWNKSYDKVYMITEWAKEKVGGNTIKIMRWLSNQARRLPNLGNKTIDNLYIFARMKLMKEK